MFFAESGEQIFLEIALAISKALGFNGKAISWSIEEAITEFGDWARYALGSNSRIRAVNARNLLGWEPREKPLLEWIQSYIDK